MKRNGFSRRDAHAAEHRKIESLLTDLLARIKEVDGSQEEHLRLRVQIDSDRLDGPA